MNGVMVFENARLIDPESGRDGVGWLRVEDGAIAALGEGEAPADPKVARRDCAGLVLAPGLIDLRVTTGEPGGEHKETLATASDAAAAGGVTTIVTTPETEPVIDDPALIDFVLRRARDTAKVRVLPAAALTRGLAGAAMTEAGLLQEAGAALLANGPAPVDDARVMLRALTYAHDFDMLVAVRPQNASLAAGGVAHQGDFAARLGLRGVPALAERIAVERDAALAESCGARLLFDQISSAAGLDAVRAAKARGAKVFASVSAAHLIFNALDVGEYRTYARVDPPFREEDDRQALIEGLASGEIDVVVSAHDPQPAENKRLPFAEAAPGAVGLETLLSTLIGLYHDDRLSLLDALAPATIRPAALLGVAQGRLKAGAPADLILIDPGAPWVCRDEGLRSRSKNTPYDGRRLQGRVRLTMVGGEIVFEAGG